MSISATDIEARFKGGFTISKEFVDLLVHLYENVETFDIEQFSNFDLNQIYAYLKASHAYYIGDLLPNIVSRLEEINEKHGSVAEAEKLRDFVKAYKAELYEHIEVEEQVILKFVHSLLNGEYDQGNRDFFFNHFLHTHNDEIISALDQIKTSVDGNDALASDESVVELFKLLATLKRDLEIHNLIEDEVFVLKTLDYVNSNYPQEAQNE